MIPLRCGMTLNSRPLAFKIGSEVVNPAMAFQTIDWKNIARTEHKVKRAWRIGKRLS